MDEAKLPSTEEISGIIGDSWFDICDQNEGLLTIESREYGTVGDDTPSREDIREGNRIYRELRSAYKGSKYSILIDAVDEWVVISIGCLAN